MPAMFNLPGGEEYLVLLFLGFFIVLPFWKIFKKAGHSGLAACVLVLLLFVPIVNIVVLVAFAFRPWPIEEELRHLRAMHA